jgi:pSer/pThr/pTyr-binding forkhead associated (FHA) protein
MDVFEKMNKAFSGWYESWFGDAVSDIRPKDVLRKVVGAMEDNRKEGLDNRIYVPNKYILEIAFETEEEKEYLLAFLDKDEFESALRKFMAQNKYYVRGPLDFTIEEVTPEGEAQPPKLTVKAKWDVRPMEKETEPPVLDAPPQAVPGTPYEPYEEEEYTVAGTDVYDASTIAPPTLNIKHADGSTSRFSLTKPVTVIGRSHRLNNDLVIENDGMVSKHHAQISLGPDGFTITDLGSTNGVWVNDEKVTKAILRSGDVVRLGVTELVFEESGVRVPIQVSASGAISRPRLVIDRGGRTEEFRLASEITLGRSLTSDVRFDDHSVAQRHARIFARDNDDYYIEDTGSDSGTMVNGVLVPRSSPVRLHSGDEIRLGEVGLRFEVD